MGRVHQHLRTSSQSIGISIRAFTGNNNVRIPEANLYRLARNLAKCIRPTGIHGHYSPSSRTTKATDRGTTNYYGGSNRTYRNQTRVRKEFQTGDIVACRQLQVSTGPNSSLKPRHTGPYAVLQVNNDTLSCIVEDLTNGVESKQHFTNLIHVPFNPETQRVHGNFIDELHEMALDIANNRIQIRPQLRRTLRIPQILSQDSDTQTQGTSQSQDPSEPNLNQQDRTLHHH